MQAVQWQTRLQKKMGKESVSDSFFFKSWYSLIFLRKTFFQDLENMFLLTVVLLTKGIVISNL